MSHERHQISAISPPRRQLHTVMQHNDVLAMNQRFEGLNAVDIHDGGSVNTRELGWVQSRFQTREVFAQQVGTFADVQSSVIALRFDPVDVRDADDDAALAAGHN